LGAYSIPPETGLLISSDLSEQLTAPGAESLVPKTCHELPLFAILISDQIRQTKADFQLVLLVPGLKSMAPVLAIAGMVAKGGHCDRPFDPVGEIPQPIVTGPNWILIFHEETTDEGRQEVVAKPEGEKGMGSTIAIGGPRLGGSSCSRRGD
jgi:hypothetical protein